MPNLLPSNPRRHNDDGVLAHARHIDPQRDFQSKGKHQAFGSTAHPNAVNLAGAQDKGNLSFVSQSAYRSILLWFLTLTDGSWNISNNVFINLCTCCATYLILVINNMYNIVIRN